MSLFGNKPQVPEKNQEIESVRAGLEAANAGIGSLKEDVQKQIAEICSALNVLDGDLQDLKAGMAKAAQQSEIKEMKSAVESLTLIGRLCLQNKADIEVLAKKISLLERPRENDVPIKGPAKILN